MLKETQGEIDAILNQYNKDIVDKEKEMQERLAREQEFAESYKQVKNEVILPAMKEVSDYLDANGQSAVIRDNEREKVIFMNIFPDRIYSDSHPSISFLAVDDVQKISIHTRSFMPNGNGEEKYHGEFTLKSITKPIVEKMVLDLIKESYSISEK